MRKMKKEEGITLVVLVITIIVLLILGVVTIILISGENGIFKTAEGNDKEALEEEITSKVDKTAKIDSSVSALKAGDYIKYDSGANGIITCRVLYPASSEYGLQIISDKNVKQVTLGVKGDYSASVESYNSLIETLNNEAEVYVNTAYAQDARCVGSLPTVDAKGNFTQKDNGSTTYYSTLSFTNESYINNALKGDENYKIDEAQMKTAGIWKTREYYNLASRVVRYLDDNSECYFAVRYVGTGGKLFASRLSMLDKMGRAEGYSYKGRTSCCYISKI